MLTGRAAAVAVATEGVAWHSAQQGHLPLLRVQWLCVSANKQVSRVRG